MGSSHLLSGVFGGLTSVLGSCHPLPGRFRKLSSAAGSCVGAPFCCGEILGLLSLAVFFGMLLFHAPSSRNLIPDREPGQPYGKLRRRPRLTFFLFFLGGFAGGARLKSSLQKCRQGLWRLEGHLRGLEGQLRALEGQLRALEGQLRGT